MKKCISLASVCVLMLVASAISIAQQPSASPAHPTMFICELCPVISVSCPSDVDVGQPIEFKASTSNSNAKLSYTWEVVGGVLANGQGTAAIRVNDNTPGRSVTATLRVGGLDAACLATASCSTRTCGLAPNPIKVDSYSEISSDDERARLDIFREVLKRNPGGQGYILVYGGRWSREDAAHKAVERARRYMVNELGIDQARIVTVDGGFIEEQAIELWLVPVGAAPPTAEPTVQPTEVKFIKQRRVRG